MPDPYRTSAKPASTRRSTAHLGLTRTLLFLRGLLTVLCAARVGAARHAHDYGFEAALAAILFAVLAATFYGTFRERRLIQKASCMAQDAEATKKRAPRLR
jgi:hypothetical protein